MCQLLWDDVIQDTETAAPLTLTAVLVAAKFKAAAPEGTWTNPGRTSGKRIGGHGCRGHCSEKFQSNKHQAKRVTHNLFQMSHIQEPIGRFAMQVLPL